MRKVDLIFEKILPVIKKALSDRTDNRGNIPKIYRNPTFSDIKVMAFALACRISIHE